MNPKQGRLPGCSQAVDHRRSTSTNQNVRLMDRSPSSRRPTKSPTYGIFLVKSNADMPLNEKEREIAELQRQLQEILAERNDLKIKLKTVEEEVEELKKTSSYYETSSKKQKGRIAMLENDRTTLQVRLRTVEAKIIKQENEMKDLAKQNEDRKEENRKLNEKFQKVEYKLTKENEKLKGEMKDHKQEVRELKETIAAFPIELMASKQTIAFLHLGELCCQIQDSMYKRILPEYYTSGLTYKVETIEEDMMDLPETESERKEAKNKWIELKSSLNWDVRIERAVKVLQRSRNIEAHPPIDETSLRECALTLDHQGELKGRLSLERVNKLIEIWKRLKQEES